MRHPRHPSRLNAESDSLVPVHYLAQSMVEKKAMLGTPRVVNRPSTLDDLKARFPALNETLEAVSLFVFTPFFLFYGLVPIFGGDGLGLVGADEPRYAQIAREMLSRHDYVTPVLWGHPWLEKPALYYWRAMFAFLEFGVHDWSARLPSASFAFILVALIYLHLRRFRPGSQLDAALITASCAGIVGFARGASTDMQLAAPFCIGMLGWYAWYETDRKFWLFDLYFFVGIATLAKGPVAPAMAGCIIFSFAALRREWSLLRRTIWIPGVLLYFAMVLPWYIAVQHRNPDFLRIFFLEHNLERFATGRFMHEQPFWYYIPVLLLALMPWSVIAMRALVDAIQLSIAEWRARRAKHHYVGHSRWGDAFPEFLVLWTLFPIIFFSLSQSKLPGYILPSIPPLTILTGDYINRIRHKGLNGWLLVLHAALSAVTIMLVLLLPWRISSSWSPAAGQHFVAGDFERRGCGDSHPDRCRPLWRQAHASGDHGAAGDHAVVYLWSWPVLRPARAVFYQEKHPPAGRCLLGPAAGGHHQPDCQTQRSRRRLSGAA